MATSTTPEAFKALALALLAFQQEFEQKQKEELEKREDMDEEELEEAGDASYPEEMEDEQFVEMFTDWLTSNGLDSYKNAKLSTDDGKRLDHILGRGE